MANKRDIKLDEFNISKFAYRELNNFCLQYPEKVKSLKNITYLKAQTYSDMPHGSEVGNPTMEAALRNVQLSNDIRMIEQSAIEAAPEIYQYIMLMATEGYSFAMLKSCYMPCEKSYFYNHRRMFYYILAKRKGVI